MTTSTTKQRTTLDHIKVPLMRLEKRLGKKGFSMRIIGSSGLDFHTIEVSSVDPKKGTYFTTHLSELDIVRIEKIVNLVTEL